MQLPICPPPNIWGKGRSPTLPRLCPVGAYCPANTTAATLQPCPSGTFGNRTGLALASQCTPCAAGAYCATPGLTAPTGPCAAAYYCQRGANTSTPLDGRTGNLCPAGSYCPEGSGAPRRCPAGTFSNQTGASALTICLLKGMFSVQPFAAE